MSTEQPANVAPQSRLVAWASAVAAYGAASLVQILMYGAGAMATVTFRWSSGVIYIALVLAWLLGPAAIATWFLARRLKFWKDIGTDSLGVPRALALLLLPMLSSYLGAAVSVNVWGT